LIGRTCGGSGQTRANPNRDPVMLQKAASL
jgi:hypothetical protein